VSSARASTRHWSSSGAELPARLEWVRPKNPALAADLQDLLEEQQTLGKEGLIAQAERPPSAALAAATG